MKYFIGKNGKFTPFTRTTMRLLSDLLVDKRREINPSENWNEINKLIDAPNTVFKCNSLTVSQLDQIIAYKQIYSVYAIDSHDRAVRHALSEEAMLVFSFNTEDSYADLASFSYLTLPLSTLNSLYRKYIIDDILETL